MKINSSGRFLVASTVSVLLAGAIVGPAHAEGTAGVYYQVEGAAGCNQFSPNTVMAIDVNGPMVPTEDASAGDFTYSLAALGGSAVLSWQAPSDNPVNAVILVGQKIGGKQKSVVYHFGTNGATSDANEVGPSGALARIEFCYGLSAPFDPPPPPEPEPLAVCTDLDGIRLDNTGIVCPPPTSDQTDERIIFSVDPNGKNGGISVCTCNFDHPLTPCSTDIEAGLPGSCLPDPSGATGVDGEYTDVGLKWVPWEVMGWQNGTGFCWTTLSGARQCAYR